MMVADNANGPSQIHSQFPVRGRIKSAIKVTVLDAAKLNIIIMSPFDFFFDLIFSI